MKQLEGNLLELASNLLYACHGSAYILGRKKSLLVLDRFLHSFKASNLPHACHGSATFWGARKASLCLTDFFIASQHQIFLMLAIFLPNSWGEEMPPCSWLIPSQQEKGRHKEFFLASIRTSFPLWGFCCPFWRNRNASHYLRAFILRITLKQKTCFSFLLAGYE